MPSANVPTVRMRRIGSALRKAREASGMTLDTACRRYGRSKGWLSTLENGLHTIDPQELADLLDFYDVPDGPLRESLLHLAFHVRDASWQRAREGRISAAALDLASLEEDAALIRSFEASVVPGLLQTPDYTRAILAVGTDDVVRNARKLLEFRMARQRVLERANPPHYVAVISESVLRHQVGDAAVMRTQRERLAEVARLGHVTVRVLPNAASAYLCLAGPFHLIALRPPGRLTVSVVEHFASSLFVDDDVEVAAHERIFARLVSAALDEKASLDIIDRLASQS